MHLFCTNFFSERGDKFYIWNEEYNKLDDFDEIESFINDMDGVKGTSSSLIAEIANIEKNNFEHLVIVTDGKVTNDEID